MIGSYRWCLAQREEGTDEEEEDTPGDYIGDRLAHARLEATGQLYREVPCSTEKISMCFRSYHVHVFWSLRACVEEIVSTSE